MQGDNEIERDVVVLGGGSAGMAAYRAATRAGAHAMLVEQSAFGTTCARVGCMPSKLLIAASEAAHARESGHAFGLPLLAPLAGDGLAPVMRRLRVERDRFVGFVQDEVADYPAHDRLVGAVRFVDDHAIEVADPGSGRIRVRAHRFVIATGSSPVVPQELDAVRALCMTTDALFELPCLPDSAAIVGTGVVALEIGQALHRLGVRVRLFGRGGRLGVLTDPQLRSTALAVWHETLPLEHDAVARYSKHEGGVRVHYVDRDGEEAMEDFSCVIAACGRRPNLRWPGIENTTWGSALQGSAGGAVDRHTLRLRDTHLFVAGDAAGGEAVLHEAVDEGRIAGRNAARFPVVESCVRRARLGIAFTSPQMAVVGGGWAQVASGANVHVGQSSFANQGRSRVMLRNQGALHVYADDAGRFLGAEMLGPDAEHLGHLMAWALQAEMSVAQMLSMPYYHPVVEEGLRSALQAVARRLRRGC